TRRPLSASTAQSIGAGIGQGHPATAPARPAGPPVSPAQTGTPSTGHSRPSPETESTPPTPALRRFRASAVPRSGTRPPSSTAPSRTDTVTSERFGREAAISSPTSRAMSASARGRVPGRSRRSTVPSRTPRASATGSRSTPRRSRIRAASATGADGSTVAAGRVIGSAARTPAAPSSGPPSAGPPPRCGACAGGARPLPPFSAPAPSRGGRSPSATVPTTLPAVSVTGRAPTPCSSMTCAIRRYPAPSGTEAAPPVMTSPTVPRIAFPPFGAVPDRSRPVARAAPHRGSEQHVPHTRDGGRRRGGGPPRRRVCAAVPGAADLHQAAAHRDRQGAGAVAQRGQHVLPDRPVGAEVDPDDVAPLHGPHHPLLAEHRDAADPRLDHPAGEPVGAVVVRRGDHGPGHHVGHPARRRALRGGL